MNLRWIFLGLGALLGGGFTMSGPAQAAPMSIRLRNETIPTPDPAAPATRAAARTAAVPARPPASGLHLVQFTDTFQEPWRNILRSNRVELLHYVPDQAFVARFDQVSPDDIQTLPFVRWVGPFEPRHKLDRRIVHTFAAEPATNVLVKVLALPGLVGRDLALLLGNLTGPTQFRSLSLGTFAQGRVEARHLWALAQSPVVLWIEPAPRMQLVDEIATKIVAGDDGERATFAWIHQLGYDGRGVTVAVADSGLDLGDADVMHPDLAGRVDAFFAYDNLPDASDEHSHGTHCAGIVAGNAATGETDDDGNLYGLGVAPGARLVAQRIFDGQGNYRPPPSFSQMAQDAVRSGAYVGSNSWGDEAQGEYDLSAAEFDALVRDADAVTPGDQQYILEFSAGNSGPGGQTINSPAVAKNVIATGACENNRFGFGIYDNGAEVMADFSSRGPAADGRIKPDLVAPGTWIASLKSRAAGEENAWSPINENYLYQGGTSQAGPHASGACAIVVQWYRQNFGGATPSPALVKAALINSADDMTTAVIPGDVEDPDDPGIVVGDTGPIPNNDEGWGRLNLLNLVDSERRHELVDQADRGLRTGELFERRYVVGANDTLKVTLVYTDVPGLPAAIPALVNDLDLEVVAPNGLVYRGNAFADGESVAGTPVGDRLNNVEAVHLSTPQAGEYTVRIRAVNVVQDIRRRTNAPPEQDFALVVSGQLPAPGEGVVAWDRPAYQSPTSAVVRLVDQQLASQPTALVRVASASEPGGFNLTLDRVGNSGSFTGAVLLVTSPANPADGALTARHGDELTAVYQDAAPAGERRATAVVDNVAPVIDDVATVQEFGRTLIRWSTGEPANSRVYFGTTNAVTNVVVEFAYRTQHSLALPPLTPGETYFYYVVGSDFAGNVTTNDFGGNYFRFTGPRTATALMVYEPETLVNALDLPWPGPETWTGTLDALGVDYDYWDVGERGRAPTTNELRNYRLVVWRPQELQPPAPGIIAAMNRYVEEGGSLFAASFDILSRLAEVGQSSFATNVLRVTSFLTDGGASSVESVRGDPIGAGLQLDLDYSGMDNDLFQLVGISIADGADHLQIATNAAPVFVQEDGRIVGVRYPRTGQDASRGRTVFLSFPLEAVPGDAPAPNNRATVLGNALEFLLPGLRGVASVAFDNNAYTVPASVIVEVSDTRRSGNARVEVEIAAPAESAPVRVECFETPVRGVFRGRFTLVPTNAPAGNPPPLPGPGSLATVRARHGDTLSARYLDTADRATLTEAVVDTVAPQISGIAAEPAYNEAIIYWETDKPTDALVRFGESGGDDTFLSRTAYNAEFATVHEVQVKGLQPDRDYFYKIVSRDAAGNVVEDDNGGRLHRLRTLKPLPAPWRDDLESGRTGWAVYDDESVVGGGGGGIWDDEEDGGGLGFTTASWEYGTPENARGVTAHSGNKCWATNLGGKQVDIAASDLITPAVNLTGGNRAKLRFWHYHDFSTPDTGGEDDGFGDFTLEAAQVAISTNDGATWTDLWFSQVETTDDWEEVEIDISRYLGSVVRFRFNYQYFSFNTQERLGWFIDDVGVDLNIVPETAVWVTNNLNQATFTLTGPTNTWQGFGTAWRTNVPPGTYVVTWNPVPFQITPVSQTNVVGTGTNATVFAGRYAQPDTNANAISDLWEQHHFGRLLTSPVTADFDGDGASDLAEFLAGTSPTDSASVLRLEPPEELPNRTVRLRWPSQPGREYVLEGGVAVGVWQPFSNPARGTGGLLEVILPALDTRLPYFFRVRVVP